MKCLRCGEYVPEVDQEFIADNFDFEDNHPICRPCAEEVWKNLELAKAGQHASVTHLAGPTVGYQGRGIQRCAVCGDLMSDSLNQAAPLNPDGSAPEMLRWAEGHLIQYSGGNPNQMTDLGSYVEAETIPDDFCISLVE